MDAIPIDVRQPICDFLLMANRGRITYRLRWSFSSYIQRYQRNLYIAEMYTIPVMA